MTGSRFPKRPRTRGWAGSALNLVLSLCALTIPLETSSAEAELTLIHADGNTIDRVVPASGKVPLIFHLTGDRPATFDVDVNTFISTNQQQIAVTIGAPGGARTGGMARLVFGRDESRKELQLSAAELVPGVEYEGTLTASGPGRTPRTWTVTLVRPTPTAELSADVGRAELDVAMYLLPSIFRVKPPPAEFLVTLTEKSGDIGIEGLTVRRAPGSELHEDFDLKRDLRFYLDGKRIENFTSWNPDEASKHAALRNIPAGEQRALSVQIADLPRGEHKLVLQINAVNAQPDSAPTVELTVRVRHAWIAPTLLLLTAIIVSFFLTKGVVNWRKRLKLRELTRSLDREWLQDVREKPHAVWLKATRRQALMVLDRFSLLPAPEDLLERLETAMRLLNLMRRYLDLRDEVESHGFPYMLNFRMGNDLENILGKIDPAQLSDTNEATLTAELDAFEQALDDPSVRYRPYVTKARQRTRGMAVVDKLDIATAAQVTKLEKLWADYVVAEIDSNASLDDLIKVDRVCAAMRVLNRHIEFGDTEVLTELLTLIAQDDQKNIDIVTVFSETNQAVWEKIKAAVEHDKVHISPSERLPSATSRKALVPTTFEVVLADPTLNDVFMVKQRMLAEWRFELETEVRKRFGWKKTKKTLPWVTKAVGKRLSQFAPDGGTLKSCVTLQFEDNACEPLCGNVTIEQSHVALGSRLFAVQEFVLILVSVVIALASGLVLYYYPNPSFGSLQDYLALFTWGVGVDQGKNLAQTFQSLSSQSKNAD